MRARIVAALVAGTLAFAATAGFAYGAPATATELVDMSRPLGGSGTALQDTRAGQLTSPAQSWTDSRLDAHFGPHRGEHFRSAPVTGDSCGERVAVGDVDGSGLADLVIACRSANGADGRVVVMVRSASNDGFTHEVELAPQAGGNAEECGRDIAVGDINGDGRADVVVSCWFGTVGADADAGYVRVFIRNPSNDDFLAGVDLAAPTPQAGEHCGASVDIGDVDGDGLGDIVTGCPDWGPGAADSSGSLIVYTRNAANNGFDAGTRLSLAAPAAGDLCGYAVAVGDVDGNGRDDVVAGCTAASPGANANAGQAVVFRRNGANSGFIAGVTLVAADAETFEGCGQSVRVADADGDGRDDVFAGCYSATVGANAFAGRVVLHTRNAANNGFDASTSIADAAWGTFGQCGTDLSVGDVDGDGDVDVLAGCPFAAAGALQFTGAAELMLGDGTGAFTYSMQLSDPDAAAFDSNLCGSGVAIADADGDGRDEMFMGCTAGDSGVVDSGTVHEFGSRYSYAQGDPTPTAGAACGAALASGDFDGDGTTELAMGCRSGESSPSVASGTVVIMPSDDTGQGLGAGAVTELAPTSTAGDDCGFALATGELQADARRDLVVGCPGVDGGRGQVAVYSATGSAGSISFSAPTLLGHPSPQAGDACGAAVSLADVNGDKRHDLIVGCPGDDVGSAVDAGSTLVYLRAGTGFAAATVLTQLPAEAGAACGSSVGVAFVGSDNRADVLMGCPLSDVASNAQAGRVLYVPRAASNNGFDAPQSLVRTTAAAGEMCGTSIDVGDTNGDGRDDLAVGCPHAEVGGVGDTGATIVYAGSGGAFAAEQILGADTPTTGDACGQAVLLADANLDGRDDVLMGCPAAAPNAHGGAGMVVSVMRNAANNAFETGRSVWEGTSTTAGDTCGSSVAVMDENLDAVPDVVGGCPGAAGGDGEAHIYVNNTSLHFASSTTLTTGKLNTAAHEIGSLRATWTAAGFGGTVTVQASNDGGKSWHGVTKGVKRTFSAWDDDLRLRIRLNNAPGAPPARLLSMSIATTEPIYPDTRKPRVVQVTSSLKFFNADRTHIRYLIDDVGPGTVTGVGRVVATFKGGQVPIDRRRGVDTRRLPEGVGWLVVRAWDRAGNTNSKRTKLKIDRTAPRIKGRTTKHIIGGFDFFRMEDNVSGSRFAAKRIWATRPGRTVHRIPISDRAGNTAVRKAATYRHISLAAPWYNDNFTFRGGGREFTATQANLDFVFGYRYSTAPWYQPSHMTGAFLREVQWRLRFLGYMPKVQRSTGRWDMATIEAVKRFQADHGIPAIATIGPQTREALDAELFKEIGKT